MFIDFTLITVELDIVPANKPTSEYEYSFVITSEFSIVKFLTSALFNLANIPTLNNFEFLTILKFFIENPLPSNIPLNSPIGIHTLDFSEKLPS